MRATGVPATRSGATGPSWPRAERGQSLVEAALVLPVVVLLAVGLVAVGRLTAAQGAASAVAREAARAAAAASSAAEAQARGHERAQAVAEGYGLRRERLEVAIDSEPFVRGGAVRARVRYAVPLDDLPLLGWAPVTLESRDAERIGRYRSFWEARG
jgi:TadE-like protein